MDKLNYKYEFLKTYRSIQTFMRGEHLDQVCKRADDDLGMYFLYAYRYGFKLSRNPATNFWRHKRAKENGNEFKRAREYTIIIATTAHNLPLDEVKVSLVKHTNTSVYPNPFWLVHQ